MNKKKISLVLLFNGVSMKIQEFVNSVNKLNTAQMDLIKSFFLLVDKHPEYPISMSVYEKYLTLNNKSIKSLSNFFQ